MSDDMDGIELHEKISYLGGLTSHFEEEMGEFVDEDGYEKQAIACIKLFEKSGPDVINDFRKLADEWFELISKYNEITTLSWEIIEETGCTSSPHDHGIIPLLDGIDSYMEPKWTGFFEKHKHKFVR